MSTVFTASGTEAAVEAALARLDLPAKVSILAGRDLWSLPPVPEIGLESLVMSDGPIGVRGTRWNPEDPSVALPSPTALAATWDPELARRAGHLLGQEARRKGVHVLLAPTVNLHRSPLGGRHFEAYSEDPLLTGEIGAGYVAGVQEQGIGTTVKHYVANDYETERFTASTDVSERALRELYLAPFETILAKARPWGIMSAYNSVNGVSMSEHGELQNDVLKDEWGFDGAIVSDWLAARETIGAALGGLDIAMPGAGNPWGDRLVAAVRDGSVAEEIIDDKVRRVLRLAVRVGALNGTPAAVSVADRPAPVDGAEVAREIAERSFVLAANRDGVLPLDARNLRGVAVVGAAAKHARVLGGGSAIVYPEHVVSPLDGLRAALPADVTVTYATGTDPRVHLEPAFGPQWTLLTATFRDASGAVLAAPALPSGFGFWMELPDGVTSENIASVEISGRLTPDIAGVHEFGVRGPGAFTLTAGDETLFDGDVPDDTERRFPLSLRAGIAVDVCVRRPVVVPKGWAVVALGLGHGEPIADDEELMAEAEAAAAASDVAIVVVGTTQDVESEGFDRTSLALPGRQDELVRRVLAVNPRTIVVVNAGSPVELPWADDVAAVLLVWFPGQEAGHALARVLLGAAEPGGRLPTTWPVVMPDCPVIGTRPENGVLRYDEGVFIGYRAWDRSAVAPRYAFGSGQGYTTWAYESLAVDGAEATVTVRNTGARTGREVVQVYVGPVVRDMERPVRWLAGFANVIAAPGEAVTVTIPLPDRTYQIWDGGWLTMPGEYDVEAGHSIADRRLRAQVKV